jgi:hypothetical protein
VFEHHRDKQAAEAREVARRDWQVRHDAYLALIATAREFAGTTADGLLLGTGEALFLQVTDTELVEQRRGRGTYTGHSQGISVPVARVGGRQIRYRVGASKGHYVQGELAPTAVDTGTTYITSARVVFRGAGQTRECTFAKLLGVDHDAGSGTTTLSVSNRSTPTTIHYGPACAAAFEFRLDLALAHYRDTVDEFVAGLESDLAAIDAARPSDGPVVAEPPGPTAPVPLPSEPPDPTAPHPPPPQAAASGWYPDPWRTAPLRWWDGSVWTGRTAGPGPGPAVPD